MTNNPLVELQQSMQSLKSRSPHIGWATRAKGGMLQLVKVSYDAHGKSTVSPVSEPLPIREMIDLINQIPAR